MVIHSRYCGTGAEHLEIDMVVIGLEPAKGAEPAPYLIELIPVEVLDNATVDRDDRPFNIAGANTIRVQRPGASHHVRPGLFHRTGNSGALSLAHIR
jgi:hypothetical protein